MQGIQFLRVTNSGTTAFQGVPAGGSTVWLEGQIGTIQLNQQMFRGATTNTPAGSVPGTKAKITSVAAVNAGTWTNYTAGVQSGATPPGSATFAIDIGLLDNDGYFNVYLSSY